MFCTSCGEKLVGGSKFCGNCGAKVDVQNNVDSASGVEYPADKLALAVGFFTKLKDLAEKGKVFYAEDIPENKLRAAINEYARGVSVDEVLLLVDDTVFGSATDGFLLTSDEIYSHQMAKDPEMMRFKDIHSVTAVSQKFGVELRLNDIPFITISTAKNNIEKIAGVMDWYVKGLRGQGSPDQEQSLAAAKFDEVEMVSHEEVYFPDEVKEIFDQLAEAINQNAVLEGVSSAALKPITLSPEFYQGDGCEMIKCYINVALKKEGDIGEQTSKAIAQTVGDYFEDGEFKEALSDMGYEDMVDLWLARLI